MLCRRASCTGFFWGRTSDMAAPRSAPAGARASRYYSSPDVVPDPWRGDRPAEIDGLQPSGARLGSQGPDQGFALRIARLRADDVCPTPGEDARDLIAGCLGIALRRASMFSRAPVVHDIDIAFTIWGLYDDAPPSELVELRRTMFAGVAHTGHHYDQARRIVDMVPESTLRATPAQITSIYPAQWRALTGVAAAAAH